MSLSDNKWIKSISSEINLFSYSRLIYLVFSMFLMIYAIYIVIIFFKGDYEYILKIAEFVIIGSGTLSILAFTYAIAKNETETNEKIVHSGELLFKSTITFIISLGLLPGIGLILKDYKIYDGCWGIIYSYFLNLTTIIIGVIGIAGLFYSVFFLSVGLKELMEVFDDHRV